TGDPADGRRRYPPSRGTRAESHRDRIAPATLEYLVDSRHDQRLPHCRMDRPQAPQPAVTGQHTNAVRKGRFSPTRSIEFTSDVSRGRGAPLWVHERYSAADAPRRAV